MTPTQASRRMWPDPVERVSAFLRAAAVSATVQEFPEGTPTARAAARAVGCEPAQIVKSLVLVCDGVAVLALIPGDRRCDETKLAAAAGAVDVRMADPAEVQAATGFELLVSEELGVTPSPTEVQLLVLRTQVDPGRYILGRAG